jgi:hypothetical protein
VKIVLDHNVPKKLRSTLPDHTVSTAKEMDWAELENGDLLRASEAEGFDVMVTCDQNICYQQNLTSRNLALVVLDTNNWRILRRNSRLIAEAVERATPGSFQFLVTEA